MNSSLSTSAPNKLESAPSWPTNGRNIDRSREPEYIDTIVIGGGQAGLSTGYHLARRQQQFVILEANERIGDNWRERWDSLHLLAPAGYSSLPGMPFPAPRYSFPSRDEMASYLEMYAAEMKLPVRTGVCVRRLSRDGDEFLVETEQQPFRASQVVIATGAFHHPRVPDFASKLDPGIRQLHSSDYRNPAQFLDGGVLVVGASNSGAEIAYEAARDHRTWLSGRDTGTLPFHADSPAARFIIPVMWFMFSHVLTVRTPLGRKFRSYVRAHGAPLERIRAADLAAAGVERVHERTVGVRDGKPVLEDGRMLDVTNVVWCTGFRPDFGWIEPSVTGADGWPRQQRGVVLDEPGLYFVGLLFLYALTSSMIGGVGRDAAYVARHIARHASAGSSVLAKKARV